MKGASFGDIPGVRMNEGKSETILQTSLETVREGVALMRLSGEIDLSSAAGVTDKFAECAGQGLTDMVVDATGVTFMDSTGLHALIEGKRLVHDDGIRIYLVPSPQVRRVLELVFPEPLFAARLDSVEEALAAVDGNSAVGA
ncbi:MAG TPA: STAS domain-containing protein [Acidimicrobiia bacterium]|nr:STAS domain-containing protein [Acidimicrobiia bacterium]